jgi:BASS family bile acid:Na+ symporter
MAIWIVLPILTLLMFDLGLTLKFEDFGKVFRSPWPIAIALVGQLILLPLIALGLAWAFKLPPVFFIGLVLIACCPGGSSSNVFSKLAGGDVALSVTLTALSSVITLFTIPVIMSLATTMVGQSVGITLPVGNLIKQNLLLMLVPVLLGIGMHYAWPNAAEKTDKVLGKLAFPLLLVLITVFYVQHHKTIEVTTLQLSRTLRDLKLLPSLLVFLLTFDLIKQVAAEDESREFLLQFLSPSQQLLLVALLSPGFFGFLGT